MARRLGVVAVALLIAACGGDGASSAAATSSSSPTVTSTSEASTSTTSTTVLPAPPAVVSLASGRGDDDSLEVGVWFASDPFESHSVVIGVDADESFPGTGDPFEHLEGRLEITPDGETLFEGTTAIASGPDLGPLVSWGYTEGVLRVFFIGTVPPKAGTVWVIVERGGTPVTGGVAGAPFGTACSYHDAGLGLAPVGGGVPNPGTPCRYPLG